MRWDTLQYSRSIVLSEERLMCWSLYTLSFPTWLLHSFTQLAHYCHSLIDCFFFTLFIFLSFSYSFFSSYLPSFFLSHFFLFHSSLSFIFLFLSNHLGGESMRACEKWTKSCPRNHPTGRHFTQQKVVRNDGQTDKPFFFHCRHFGSFNVGTWQGCWRVRHSDMDRNCRGTN